VLSRKYDLARTRSPGLYFTLIVIAVLSFLQWEPPGTYTWLESFNWYLMIGVAGYLFILQRGRLNTSGIRFYIIFNFLFWLGGVLSLFRTPSPDQVLYSAVSMTIPFFLGLVMLSAMSTNKGRAIWLYTLLIAALLWAYEVVQLWFLYGENIRHFLYGPGRDHNLVAIIFAMAATALMIIFLYGDFAVNKSTQFLIKGAAFSTSLGLLICSFLTYSRSGFIATIVGIFFTLFSLFLSERTRMPFVIFFILLLGGLSVLTSVVQTTNPTWFIKFNEITRLEDPTTSVFVRTVLLQKALAVIAENPFIGIGPGVFRTIYDPLIGHQSFYLVHNSYLAAWAENGILGLLGYIIWLFLWIRLFLTKSYETNIVGNLCTLLYNAFFPRYRGIPFNFHVNNILELRF